MQDAPLPADRPDARDPGEHVDAPSASPGSASAEGAAIPLWAAIVPVVALIAFLIAALVWLPSVQPNFAGSGHIPLVLAAGVAALVARSFGHRWEHLALGVRAAIDLAMGAILILLVIGMLMGTWLAAGIVPAFIDWGLQLLHPKAFLAASCLVCAVVALVSGSSWSTAGTVGLALVGVGEAMGVDPAYTAGAVVSGAYFGDKLSPMSDTTNLAPAMAGTDLFTHVRNMLWTTIPSIVIALTVYVVLGLSLGDVAAPAELARIHSLLVEQFSPSLVHLSVPLVVGVLVARQAPALPSLVAGAVLGGLLALVQGVPLTAVIDAAMSGYQPDTGDAVVDELLRRGGMASMSNTVLLILCAMTFGGIMERAGMLRVIAEAVLSVAKSARSLVVATVLTSIAMNVLAADQYIALVVPGRMYAPAYRQAGLHAKHLSRALEDGGTITSALVPWNTCGAFMSTTLAVSTVAYLPYAVFNWVNPLVSITMALLGIGLATSERPRPEDAPTSPSV